MSPAEHNFGVWLGRTFVGIIRQRGDHCRFSLHASYADDPLRPVLSQVFEQDLDHVHSAALRLPPWFSNLLPEGQLRRWMAQDRGVSDQREMELLAQVGHDLPGAVTVLALPDDVLADGRLETAVPEQPTPVAAPADGRPRFSLAGVQLTLSMVQAGDRLVVPLGGAAGDWIVKFPDATIPHLPLVEHATMELATRAGIDVPDIRLLSRDELPDTPSTMWTSAEDRAFAVRRFDRGPSGSRVHIEDLAQVRNVWATEKYQGSFETLAALIHRGRDTASLTQMARRLAFNILVDNSDAHLKNWSLRYADPRRPVLSPAYDVVSVAPYPGYDDTMALSLNGTKRADQVRVSWLERLGRRIDVPTGELAAAATDTVARAVAAWPEVGEALLADHPRAREAIGATIGRRAVSLLG